MAFDLLETVRDLGTPRVLVVGDLMLDRYIWGNADRISQEAPVILLRADQREERLGGASSVASMLRVLGADVTLFGVVGADADASHVAILLDEFGICTDGVIPVPARPTTVKERYIGRAQARHPQQMLRVDYETREAIDETIEWQIYEAFEAALPNADIALISDYDKGVCTTRMVQRMVQLCRRMEKPIVADPIRGGDYSRYRGCTVITPNRLEAGLATGRAIQTIPEAKLAARKLRESLDLDAAIVTLDKDGMLLSHRDGRCELFPTRPRQVYDITGAGDMVMSVLGLTLAAGVDFAPAIRLANIAGGLEVEKIGVVTLTREQLVADILATPQAEAPGQPPIKVRSLAHLLPELEFRRRNGQRIVFTNGCFDLLHVGHVQYLQEARRQGDLLIVGLNSDSSIRELKGPGRPVNPVEARATVLASLSAVDHLVVFDTPTPLELIQAIRPDVLVKGADYLKEQVVGGDLVESLGGRVHLAELREGVSTTATLERLKVAG